MLYVGSGLRAIAPYRDVEPSLIDPLLPVQPGPASATGEGMGYWPTYADITPEHRAGFLQWLADGRKAPDAYIGYVFLFFYGLERRAFHDPANAADPNGLSSIVAEVERLRSLYSGNSSFAGYAAGFLNFCRFRSGDVGGNLRSGLFGWEVPADVRLRLGQFAAAKTPIPADLAFAWACNLPSAPRRTPATRCQGEFRELFAIRYERECAPGVVLKNKGPMLSLSYRPASPGFGGAIEQRVRDVCDVTKANEGAGERLAALADRCVEDLDAYSRWLGRNANADGQALAGVALLPRDLLQRHGAPALADLRQWLGEYVPHDRPLVTGASEVLARWQPGVGQRVTKGDATLLMALLEKMGFGMEPDVRFGGPSPSPAGQIALFRVDSDFSAPTAEYSGVTTLLRFAAAVAGADGVAEGEARFLSDHVSAVLGLGNPERRRLAAHAAWLLADPPGPAGLKKAAEALTPGQRADLGRFLVSVAGADGTVSRAEVQMLLKVFALLGLPGEAVYTQVHELGGSMPVARTGAADPVTVRPAGPADREFAIPGRPAANAVPAAAARGVQLDMARVQAQIAESARVSAVLAEIFRGEEDVRPPTPTPEVTSVAGLDAPHSLMIWRLRDVVSVGRAEWDALCVDLGILPDGAIDTLNEAAFDRVGDPLLTGDDPIHLDTNVYRSLLA
ncbi:TerB N-terminal domain-containing protein [Myxococcota bacterium]|nr:TerB N-terminal domain-containing protein [Myxococcota bacterium]